MDKYSKGVVLGRGTFGEVIKATHTEVRRGRAGLLLCWGLSSQSALLTVAGASVIALQMQTGEVVAIKKIRIGEKGEVGSCPGGAALIEPAGLPALA